MKSKLLFAFRWVGSPMATFMHCGVWAFAAVRFILDAGDHTVSTEMFKCYIEDHTKLGEVATKAIAIAGLSK